MVGILTPFSTEVYPTALRGIGSGVVSASTKAGGIVAPTLIGALIAAAAGLTLPVIATAIPMALAGFGMAAFGVETRGRRLEELTAKDVLAGDAVVAAQVA